MDAADVLMSPNFGAFGGLEVNQTTALRELEAQKRMGEIALQPTKMRQEQAQTRLYEAQAAEHEENVATQKRMAELMKGLPPGGSDTEQGPGDMADRMLRLSDVAFKGGFLKPAVELATKASTIYQHVAAAEASGASADLRRARTVTAEAERIGALAGAALENPDQYDALRMTAINEGFPAERLPVSFEEAAPRLRALVRASISAKDKAAQTTRDRSADAEIKKDNAQAGAATAAAAASAGRLRLLTKQIADIEKNGGDTTGGARDLRKARKDALAKAEADKVKMREAQEKKQASIDAARFPPPTEKELQDPTKRIVGKTYSTPKGPLTWTGQGWVRPGGAATARPPVSTVPDEDLDDED